MYVLKQGFPNFTPFVNGTIINPLPHIGIQSYCFKLPLKYCTFYKTAVFIKQKKKRLITNES